MKIKTVLPEQNFNVRFNEYTVKLAVSELDSENKHFSVKQLGEFIITLTKSANDYELIARLKKLYPELTVYRNIEVLTKSRKDVNMIVDMDKFMKLVANK